MGEQCFNQCNKFILDKLPEKITHIDCSTFAFTAIKDLTLPDGIMYIPQFAFLQCDELEVLRCRNVRLVLECGCYMAKKLREVHFSDKLELVQGQSFYKCESLKKIVIHEYVNFDKVIHTMDIDTVYNNQTNRFLVYKLPVGNQLLFAMDQAHDSKVALFTPDPEIQFLDHDPEPNNDSPYSKYALYRKEFDINFIEFIEIANIEDKDGNLMKETLLKNKENIKAEDEKKIIDTFKDAIIKQSEKATNEVLNNNDTKVETVTEKINDEQ